ncbi:hypothetical protein DFH09DRAFT_1311088 [Mycena vulgaris]|nr:hypothetical protein DFH09DRAFT_1311088 [Mycena vulgaris]
MSSGLESWGAYLIGYATGVPVGRAWHATPFGRLFWLKLSLAWTVRTPASCGAAAIVTCDIREGPLRRKESTRELLYFPFFLFIAAHVEIGGWGSAANPEELHNSIAVFSVAIHPFEFPFQSDPLLFTSSHPFTPLHILTTSVAIGAS